MTIVNKFVIIYKKQKTLHNNIITNIIINTQYIYIINNNTKMKLSTMQLIAKLILCTILTTIIYLLIF